MEGGGGMIAFPAIIQEFAVGEVCELLRPRQVPVVGPDCLEAAHVFEPVRDIDSVTVTLYPPDLVVIMRVLADGRHVIARYGGATLCVIATRNLQRSEVRRS